MANAVRPYRTMDRLIIQTETGEWRIHENIPKSKIIIGGIIVKKFLSVVLAIGLCIGLAVTAVAGGDFSVHFEDGAAIVDETRYIGYDGVEKLLPEGWGFYDPDAHTFGELTYHDGVGVVVKDYYIYEDGFYNAKEDGGEYVFGAVNGQGSLLFQVTAEHLGVFSEGLAPIRQGGKWGLVDKAGKLVLAPVLEAEYVSAPAEGMLRFRQNSKYGFADIKGNIAVAAKYDYAENFSEGLAAVTIERKSGFIEKAGVLALPMQYGNASSFHEGLAAVNDSYNGGNYYYIDNTGAVAIEPNVASSNCSEGLLQAADGRGFVDKIGAHVIILPENYKTYGDFHEGLALIIKESTEVNSYGYPLILGAAFIDKLGNIVIDDLASGYQTSDFNEGYAVYERLDNIHFSLGIIKKPLSSANESPVPPASATAKPTASPVLVNGAQTSFDAYNIADNNYFKLRDLAHVLSGTEKQFEVGYDEATKAIALTSGQSYTAVGGEMEGKGAESKTANPTSSKIYLDGEEISLTAYNIGGNNYFKLRDIGETFDFEVDWDGENRTIVIDTSKGYTAD
jgi:hypothetical protein